MIMKANNHFSEMCNNSYYIKYIYLIEELWLMDMNYRMRLDDSEVKYLWRHYKESSRLTWSNS